MKPTITSDRTPMSPEEVYEHLIHYTPRLVTPTDWDDIRPYVLATLARFEFGSKGILQGEVILLGRFTAWCRAQDLPLDHDMILTPAKMASFFADPTTPTETPASRWSFTRWGRVLTPHEPWTPQRKKRSGERPPLFRPYTDAQVDFAWNLAPQQTTDRRRKTAIVLISLCEGAGLHPAEAKWATPNDLETIDGALWIRVGDPNPRRVPIRQRYTADLTLLAKHTEPAAPLTGRDPHTTRANYLTSVVLHHVDLHEAPRLSGSRLRHTWIRRHLEHDVPIRDLLHAAGAIDTKTLADAIKTLQPSNPDEYLRNLLSA